MNPSRWNSHGNPIKGLQRQMRPRFARSDIVLALKEAVPSMEGGFIISTVSGDVSYDGADAEAIAGLVRALLEAKLGARRALTRQTAVPSSRGPGSDPGSKPL